VWVFVAGTAVTVVGAVAVVAESPRGPATWMAVALSAGLLLTATGLAQRSFRLIQTARRAITEGASGALALAAAGGLAALAPGTRVALALAAGTAAVALLTVIGIDLRRDRLPGA
jgi:hypothetical protein